VASRFYNFRLVSCSVSHDNYIHLFIIMISLAQKNPILNSAIDSTPEDELLRILKTHCAKSKIVERTFAGSLLVAVGNDETEGKTTMASRGSGNDNTVITKGRKQKAGLLKSASDGPKDNDASNLGKKRLRARFARCCQCEKDFDVTENGGRSCRWHSGEGLR
jgi:hypothetical protein